MKKIAIIPAYNPQEYFYEYAKKVLGTIDTLIVVDDGSNEKYSSVFEAISKLSDTVLITNKKRNGDGCALKQAFSYCKDNFSSDDIIVTLKCDAEYHIKDIERILATSQSFPDYFVNGSRDFVRHNISKKIRSKNSRYRMLLKVLYGLTIYDTTCSLRAFSVKTAEKLINISAQQSEFEMSALIYAKRNQIPIYEMGLRYAAQKVKNNENEEIKKNSDDARITAVLIKNLGNYLGSSAISSIADVCVFSLLVNVIFSKKLPLFTLLATVIARITSSVMNFKLNCKHVFHGMEKKSFIRYYILWTGQLCCSWGIVYIFGHIFGGFLTPIKITGDLCLSVISYQIQCRWVFEKEKPKARFYGPFVRFVRFILKTFSKKFHCSLYNGKEPVVYVCRHLNMHGPYTTVKWIPFNMHPMIFNVFFSVKTASKHFSEYTFSQRVGKKQKNIDIESYIAGAFTSGVVNSLKAVPVYRNDGSSITTFKSGLSYLLKNESIIVWPDIDYTADISTPSEIYSGFLFFGQLYKKNTGKDLKFIPLLVDDESCRIIAGRPFCVENHKTDSEKVAQMLKQEINFIEI